jgi:hypothetical protein
MPLHEPVYQNQLARVPKVPPVSLNPTGFPEQIVAEGLAVIEVAGVELEFIVNVTLVHNVVLHVPIALIQYVVVVVGVTTFEVPDPPDVPPHEPRYHNQLAPVPRLPPYKLRVDEPPGIGIHKVSGEA